MSNIKSIEHAATKAKGTATKPQRKPKKATVTPKTEYTPCEAVRILGWINHYDSITDREYIMDGATFYRYAQSVGELSQEFADCFIYHLACYVSEIRQESDPWLAMITRQQIECARRVGAWDGSFMLSETLIPGYSELSDKWSERADEIIRDTLRAWGENALADAPKPRSIHEVFDELRKIGKQDSFHWSHYERLEQKRLKGRVAALREEAETDIANAMQTLAVAR